MSERNERNERKTVNSTDAVYGGEEKRKAYDAVPMPIASRYGNENPSAGVFRPTRCPSFTAT